MSALPRPKFTEAEYLALEAASDTKHEFYRGDIIAMAGASPNHVRIVGDTNTALNRQIAGKYCETFVSDLRLKVQRVKGYFYPDLMVVCGKPEFNQDNPPCLLNPTLIIEVLSPSTANFDKGEKFTSYRKLHSLQEYIVIAQDVTHIERHTRQADGSWLLTEIDGLDKHLELASIGCTLPLMEVYARVEFEEE